MFVYVLFMFTVLYIFIYFFFINKFVWVNTILGSVQTLRNASKGGGGKQSVTAHPHYIKMVKKRDIGMREV